MHTGIDLDPHAAYGDWMDTNPRIHTGMCASLYAYGNFSVIPHMHNEVVRIGEIKSCIPIQADRGCAAGAFFCGGGEGAFGQKRL